MKRINAAWEVLGDPGAASSTTSNGPADIRAPLRRNRRPPRGERQRTRISGSPDPQRPPPRLPPAPRTTPDHRQGGRSDRCCESAATTAGRWARSPASTARSWSGSVACPPVEAWATRSTPCSGLGRALAPSMRSDTTRRTSAGTRSTRGRPGHRRSSASATGAPSDTASPRRGIMDPCRAPNCRMGTGSRPIRGGTTRRPEARRRSENGRAAAGDTAGGHGSRAHTEGARGPTAGAGPLPPTPRERSARRAPFRRHDDTRRTDPAARRPNEGRPRDGPEARRRSENGRAAYWRHGRADTARARTPSGARWAGTPALGATSADARANGSRTPRALFAAHSSDTRGRGPPAVARPVMPRTLRRSAAWGRSGRRRLGCRGRLRRLDRRRRLG